MTKKSSRKKRTEYEGEETIKEYSAQWMEKGKHQGTPLLNLDEKILSGGGGIT